MIIFPLAIVRHPAEAISRRDQPIFILRDLKRWMRKRLLQRIEHQRPIFGVNILNNGREIFFNLGGPNQLRRLGRPSDALGSNMVAPRPHVRSNECFAQLSGTAAQSRFRLLMNEQIANFNRNGL